jgi:type VI protein secretion system component Hcp
MRLASRALTIAAVLATSAAGSAGAAVNVFLCADPDILGDSRDADHVGCSDAISVAQEVVVDPGAAVPGTGGGSLNCGEAVKPIVVSKLIDSASAPYLLHVLQFRRLRAVEILVRRVGPEPGPDFLKLSLLDTAVIGVQQDVTGAGDPIERITFLPRTIDWSFTPQSPNGAPGTPVQARLTCR